MLAHSCNLSILSVVLSFFPSMKSPANLGVPGTGEDVLFDGGVTDAGGEKL